VLRINTAPDAHLHRFHGALVIEAHCGRCGEPMLVKRAVCYLPHCAFTLAMPAQPDRPCRGH
jgi:hypothetical protein